MSTERRITANQAQQAANFTNLLTQVEEFLDALEDNGLLVDITDTFKASRLLEAKANLEAWLSEEGDDDET